MDRRVTTPTRGPPPPCKQALRLDQISLRSLLSRLNVFHLGELSSRSQRNYKSRRVLGEISFILQKSLSYRCRSQRYYKSRRDLVYLAAISESLQISPSSCRDFVNLDEISLRSQRHYKSRWDLVGINAISTGARRDL